jgi:hypothetical protein
MCQLRPIGLNAVGVRFGSFRQLMVSGPPSRHRARLSMQAGIVTDLNRRIGRDLLRARDGTGSDHGLGEQAAQDQGEIIAGRTSKATTLAGLQVELNPSGRTNRPFSGEATKPIAILFQRCLARVWPVCRPDQKELKCLTKHGKSPSK